MLLLAVSLALSLRPAAPAQEAWDPAVAQFELNGPLPLALGEVVADGGTARLVGRGSDLDPRAEPPSPTPGYLRAGRGERGEAGVLVLRGLRGVTLELGGGTLRGAPAEADLDGLEGFGILIEDCADVTVRGGSLGGYRGCVVARRTTGLVLEDLDFDGWFGQRLGSTPAAEDPADWLRPHENDAGEWLSRYGAAISLTDCEGFSVRRCRGRRGQNGVLLTRSNRGQVYDCDFSFLSGWGVALYRSSGNTICRNRLDYCVRGYSDGVYWRGQDSAGILMFERSSDNLVVLNSATHGGDGVFLFAGLDLVEGRALARGEQDVGGSDRNLFFLNDCSYAVANAIEMTFSRGNHVLENRCVGSHQHGLWGGYSSRMLVRGNDFSGTRGAGIEVEHGQECAFEANALVGCDTGLALYWDEDPELVEGPYGRRHDTASRDLFVAANRFEDNERDLFVALSTGVRFGANRFAARAEGEGPGLVLERVGAGPRDPREVLADAEGHLPTGVVRASQIDLILGRAPVAWFETMRPPSALPGERDPRRDPAEQRGLDSIVMGRFGPWDFESGAPRPELPPPGGLLAGAEWTASWFRWEGRADPREDLSGWRALAAEPLERGALGPITDPFGGQRERRRRVGTEFVGLLAGTEVELPPGRYALEVTSDDGVRLSIDGVLALERWEGHAPTTDRVELELGGGVHRLELEYYQVQGALALAVTLEPLGP